MRNKLLLTMSEGGNTVQTIEVNASSDTGFGDAASFDAEQAAIILKLMIESGSL